MQHDIAIDALSMTDYLRIKTDLPRFWPDNTAFMDALNHPLFVHVFADWAKVARSGERIAGYRCACISPDHRLAYCHLISVDPDFRGRGVGRLLYEDLFEQARAVGARVVKAICPPENTASQAFHRSLGFELIGNDRGDGIIVQPDYAGPGEHRCVMIRQL